MQHTSLAMPPTNIRLGMSVPYFGTDGEKATGASGSDMSIVNYTASNIKSDLVLFWTGKQVPNQGHSQKFVLGYKRFLAGIKLFNSHSDVIFTP